MRAGRFRLPHPHHPRHGGGPAGGVEVKPIIETPRLVLREFVEADAADMFDLNNDPLVIRYTGDPPFASVEATKIFIRQYTHYKTAGYGRWTTLLKDPQN